MKCCNGNYLGIFKTELKHMWAFSAQERKNRKKQQDTSVFHRKNMQKRLFNWIENLVYQLILVCWGMFGIINLWGSQNTITLLRKHPQKWRIRTALVGHKFKSCIGLSCIHEIVTPNRKHNEAKNGWSSKNHGTSTPKFLL